MLPLVHADCASFHEIGGTLKAILREITVNLESLRHSQLTRYPVVGI
jgi:hypothetical protein